MNIANHMQRARLAFGERAAVAHGANVVWRYAELGERVARIAGALRGPLGLEEGDRRFAVACCTDQIDILLASA